MLEWLQGIAAWTSPIAQILAIPTAIVTFLITVRRVRRWMDGVDDKQQETKTAAAAAAAESRRAQAEAKSAGVHSKETTKQIGVATEHLDLVGMRLKDVLDDRDLATRHDDLLTAYLRLRTIAREAGLHLPADLDPPHEDLERTQALTSITGRHILSPHRAT